MTIVTKFLGIWINGENIMHNANDVTDAASKAVQKTPNRVSIESIRSKITNTEFIYPTSIPHMTIAVVLLENGYSLVGKSAPADPENFNEELGRKFAIEDAERQAWPLEAYLLREKLTYADDG